MDQQAPREFILEAFADPPSVRDVVKGILHTIFFHRFFPSVAPRSREVLDVTLPYVADAELDTMIERRADELAQQLDAERINNNNNNNNSSAKRAIGGSRRGGGGGAAGLGIGGVGGGGGGGGDGRGTITVQFFEKKRRKAWYGGRDEEVCWESWTVKVTVAEPRTESGELVLPSLSHPSPLSLSPILSFHHHPPIGNHHSSPHASTPDGELTKTNTERAKVRAAMAQTLTATVMKLVTCVNSHKDHIPPITTSEANPFPYQIHVSPSGSGGGGAGGGAGDAATPDAAAQARTGWTTRMGIY
ncbi:hypothetical protein DL765_008795 [Monosporascus sp. GIB2]|nr:hypothetical protein DL765_008795 [Monosporascus sp. GIB2]